MDDFEDLFTDLDSAGGFAPRALQIRFDSMFIRLCQERPGAVFVRESHRSFQKLRHTDLLVGERRRWVAISSLDFPSLTSSNQVHLIAHPVSFNKTHIHAI